MTVDEMRAHLALDRSYSDLQVVNAYWLSLGDPAALYPEGPAPTPPPVEIDPEQVALDAIHDTFADREPLAYIQSGQLLPLFTAVRSERKAPAFEGPGNSLRSIAWEFRMVDVPVRPRTNEVFTHRGRRWRISDVATMDDVAAWEVIVSDIGAAA